MRTAMHKVKRTRRSTAAAVTTALVASLLAAASAVVAAPAAHADGDAQHGTVNPRPSDNTISFVDGVTYTIAQVGTKVVVGGTFTQVGPGQRGGAGVVNVAGSTFGSGFPDVAGAVYAAAPDGSGGWYLAGDFPTVGGSARADLARVDSTGTLTAWAPAANGAVRADRGRQRRHLRRRRLHHDQRRRGRRPRQARRDDGRGPLERRGDRRRRPLGGPLPRRQQAATRPDCSPPSAARPVPGSARSPRPPARSTPRSCPAPPTRTSTRLGLQGTSVWLAGDFTKVNGVTRNRLAKVDGTSGALDPLTVSVNGKVNTILTDSTSGNVYLGGAFTTVGGVARAHLAAVNMTSGAVSTLTFPTIKGDIYGIALDGHRPRRHRQLLAAAGAHRADGPGAHRPRHGRGHQRRALPADPEVPRPYAQERDERRHRAAPQRRLAARGRRLLRLRPRHPQPHRGLRPLHGRARPRLRPGARRRLRPLDQGQRRRRSRSSSAVRSPTSAASLAATWPSCPLAGGAVDPTFNPSPDAYVKDMAVKADGTALYVGGDFDNIAGQPMLKLAGHRPEHRRDAVRLHASR